MRWRTVNEDGSRLDDIITGQRPYLAEAKQLGVRRRPNVITTAIVKHFRATNSCVQYKDGV